MSEASMGPARDWATPRGVREDCGHTNTTVTDLGIICADDIVAVLCIDCGLVVD